MQCYRLFYLFGFSNISDSSVFENQIKSFVPVDTIIEELIFNAQYDDAIVVANKAINQIKENSCFKFHLLLRLSEIYIYKHNPEKAAEILHEVPLKNNTSQIANNELEFLYSLAMARMLRESGKNGEAVKWMKKSELFVRKINNPENPDVAKLYILLGRHSYETQDSINAIRYFSKSMNILSGNSLQDKMAKITSFSYLQLAYLFYGNFNKARQVEAKADSTYLTITEKNHPSLLNFYLNTSFHKSKLQSEY